MTCKDIKSLQVFLVQLEAYDFKFRDKTNDYEKVVGA